LAGFNVERAGFEEDVGAGTLEPFADVARRLRVRRLWMRMWRLVGPVIVEDGKRVEAVGVGAPAVAAGCDAGEAPADVVATAELGLLGDEEAEEGAADVAETDDGEVVGGDGGLRSFCERDCSSLRWRVIGAGKVYARYEWLRSFGPRWVASGCACTY
jgi:hypothetical protein